MTDPRYATSDGTDSAVAPEPGPQDASERTITMPTSTDPVADHGSDPAADHGSDPAEATPSTGASEAGADDGTSAGNATATVESDPQSTTELPRTGWGSPLGSQSGSASGSPSGAPAGTDAGWSSDQTQNFPAYRPQSYPTYPPIQSQTSELPAVSAGGPPPTAAAAYASPYGPSAGAGFAPGATSGAAPLPAAGPVRRNGAGIAGALGLVGLAGAAAGAFALPIQQFSQNQNAYFGNYHDLAARTVRSSAANGHSLSLAGTHIATVWWQYAAEAALGALAFVLLVQLCVPVLRRVAGVLLLLGGLATAAVFLLAAHQTNDYRSATLLGGPRRIAWQHLAYGFWVAVGGCVVVALAGLIAAAQSTRR